MSKAVAAADLDDDEAKNRGRDWSIPGHRRGNCQPFPGAWLQRSGQRTQPAVELFGSLDALEALTDINFIDVRHRCALRSLEIGFQTCPSNECGHEVRQCSSTYTARYDIRCKPGNPHETPSQESFDMTPLAEIATNTAMADPRIRRFANSLTLASLVLALASLTLACTAALADDPPVTTQIVDLANKLNGVHPGFRAFHAKGVVVEGSFAASPEAARLSRATLFDGRTIPVTVRFSDGNGMPNVADGSPAGNPHGMAIKYHLPAGADTDMVTNSLKFFPAGTAEDFRDLLQAIIASPPDAPKPTKLEQFFASHPNAPKAFGTAATPDSYADEEYHGINAFILVNEAGQRQAVRYLLVPEKPVHLSPEEAAKRPANFLSDELTQRIARKPVVFHLKAQLAEPGDQTKHGSQPWPDDRKVVELGVLTLNKLVPNSLEAEKKLLFMPTRLTAGIELSDDPLPRARAAAYAVSFARRSQPGLASSGPTQPSTVSP